MKVALTGASGFVGSALKDHFTDFIVLDRADDEATVLDKLQGVDVVINLAGAPIIKRWSDPYKKILLQSRIETTHRLVKAVNQSNIKLFISTSAIGIYPDNIPCDESCQSSSDDFLGHLSKVWEGEALKCQKPTAILCFGVVLGVDGGALAQMLTPFRLGVGGIIGDGKMMTSWIHIDDLLEIYDFIIEKKLTGIFNGVSPTPVTNYTFTKVLGSVLHRPSVLPIPIFVLRIMYGEGAVVLTGSKEIYPKVLIEKGFEFKYSNIESALKDLLK